MQVIRYSWTIVFGLIISISVMGVGYWLILQQQKMAAVLEELSGAKQEHNTFQTGSQEAVHIIAPKDLWRTVQDKAKDTVVQVFAQVAETNMLQPFKSPSQYSRTGSAFFINDKGELITNAHVANQATTMWIQIPSLGKQIVDVELVSISPDHDIALLRIADHDLQRVRSALGKIPYLSFGDSDVIRRSDEVLALGYPLGQQSLKSTTGVISGVEGRFIQMSAAINPGNSGGPLLNNQGQVIGVNSAGVVEAQNVGYIIPSNIVTRILPDLYTTPLLRKPFLGVLFNNADEHLTEFLGNPLPGGCYVVEVVKGSTLEKAGVKRGDMIYEINGYHVDVYGEMTVPWGEDKISIVDYVARLSIGENVRLIIYRNGIRQEITVAFSQSELPAVRKVYPGYEPIDYEVIGGMVVMELSADHVRLLVQGAPGLARFAEMKNQSEPVLVITHIFSSSQLYRTRTLAVGATINEVNDIKVTNLTEFREALKSGADNKFLTIRASDNVTRASDNVFVALPYDKVVQDEVRLAHDYHYAMTDSTKALYAYKFSAKQSLSHAGSLSLATSESKQPAKASA